MQQAFVANQSPYFTRLRMGGVPEHFNYPWHFAAEQNWFAECAVEFQWQDYYEGTGAMTRSLADGELDMAVLLSEGAVAAISHNCPIKILGWYTESPLLWGVHTRPDFWTMMSDVKRPRFAISRYGSGSHLMAHVLANNEGWENFDFVVVDNLRGAVEAFGRDQADLFLWERFTTQPAVDAGHMVRIGECPTPWPGFVTVASNEALERHANAVWRTSDIATSACAKARSKPGLAQKIADRFSLETGQVLEWLALTRWAANPMIESSQLEQITRIMGPLGLLGQPVAAEDCVARR